MRERKSHHRDIDCVRRTYRNASGSGGNTARSTGLHRMGANASVEINKVLDVESAKPADAR